MTSKIDGWWTYEVMWKRRIDKWLQSSDPTFHIGLRTARWCDSMAKDLRRWNLPVVVKRKRSASDKLLCWFERMPRELIDGSMSYGETPRAEHIPVKIIPHDVWVRLIAWCEDSASRFESSVETCNGWKARELKEILAEVER